MSKYDSYKKDVLQTALKLVSHGLLLGSGGNVSVKITQEDKFVITPSGMDYTELSYSDLCVVDFGLNQIEGSHKPSIESGMHVAAYKKRLDAGAIVHTHQPYGSIFAMTGDTIPAMTDEEVMTLGSQVENIAYAPSGSTELAENIGKAVDNSCNAFTMKNHGVLLLGLNLNDAFKNAQLLEKAALVYSSVLKMGRKTDPIPDESREIFFDMLKQKQLEQIRSLKTS